MSETHTFTLTVTQYEDGSGFASLWDSTTPTYEPIAEGYAIRPDEAVAGLFDDITFNLTWTDTNNEND